MTQKTQTNYRIRNWAEYNKSLVQRGSLTIWFSDEAKEKWLAEKEDKKGRPCIYSNDAILCALMIKAVYHLPFRALQGLLISIVSLLEVSLPIPSYTEICRRAKGLGQKIERLSRKRPTDIVFDSTGVKIYGEGEWKVRQHGASKRRTWKKLHLAVCPKSHDIMVACMTDSNVTDSRVLPNIKKAFPNSVTKGFGDGAYDKGRCYHAFHELGITLIVPPQKNALLSDEKSKPWLRSRNNAIREIVGLGKDEVARKLWKKLNGYHRRSLAETAMFRFKTLFGGSLACRRERYQKAEVFAKCLAINKMNDLGMPLGEWILK